MSRRIKEFVDIGDHVSLDDLIQKLAEVRDSLPEGSEAELRLRGDESSDTASPSLFSARKPKRKPSSRSVTPKSREAKERELERLQADSASSAIPRPASAGTEHRRRGDAVGTSGPARSCNSAGPSVSDRR